ncbi:von Willebrand factor-like [Lingula anatina]|uniref:von Willebrand factor-like n=1 Tax=Lingula anatina TaxID=7574 RepID=A0A1S3HS62_LINAN|nr:von Willebrand factor-like [Lingula anatina]|eukprot:XP_013388386.1 von Willebrand factor-like [Lingula anatina]
MKIVITLLVVLLVGTDCSGRREVVGPTNFPIRCQGDLEWRFCASTCPPVCGQEQPETCHKRCVIGCACPKDMVRVTATSTQCVASMADCPQEVEEEEE